MEWFFAFLRDKYTGVREPRGLSASDLPRYFPEDAYIDAGVNLWLREDLRIASNLWYGA